jgi:hypothetical protein
MVFDLINRGIFQEHGFLAFEEEYLCKLLVVFAVSDGYDSVIACYNVMWEIWARFAYSSPCRTSTYLVILLLFSFLVFL